VVACQPVCLGLPSRASQAASWDLSKVILN
jgi:hypothetical protein